MNRMADPVVDEAVPNQMVDAATIELLSQGFRDSFEQTQKALQTKLQEVT